MHSIALCHWEQYKGSSIHDGHLYGTALGEMSISIGRRRQNKTNID